MKFIVTTKKTLQNPLMFKTKNGKFVFMDKLATIETEDLDDIELSVITEESSSSGHVIPLKEVIIPIDKILSDNNDIEKMKTSLIEYILANRKVLVKLNDSIGSSFKEPKYVNESRLYRELNELINSNEFSIRRELPNYSDIEVREIKAIMKMIGRLGLTYYNWRK